MNLRISEKDELERLMNTYSMEDILDTLAQICLEKSEHASANWQDAALAKRWRMAGMKLDHIKISKPISAISQLFGA